MEVTDDSTEATEVEPGVYLRQLAVGEDMSIQGLRMEPGARVPEHSHHHEQVGYVMSGSGVFTVDGEDHPTSPGDSYAIDSGVSHSLENNTEEPLDGIDVFAPPRANPDWKD